MIWYDLIIAISIGYDRSTKKLTVVPDKMYLQIFVLYIKTYVVGTHWKRLDDNNVFVEKQESNKHFYFGEKKTLYRQLC